MAFHEIKIGSNNFTLAPQQVKPTDISTDTNYPIPFLSGLGARDGLTPRTVYTDTANSLHYNPSSNKLTTGSINVTGTVSSSASIMAGAATNMYVNIGGNIPLVIKYDDTDKFVAPGSSFSNTVNLGTSARKWKTTYATTFYGDLYGPIQTTNTSTDATYYISFVNMRTTGMRYSYVNSSLYYNPSTNTLTTTKFKGYLEGNADSANKVLLTTQTTAGDYPIIYGQTDSVTSTGVKSVHVDANLTFNPSSNILTTTQVNANLNGAVQTTSTSTSASYYLTFVNSSSTGMRYSYVNSGLYYNPSTNDLTVSNGKVNATEGFYETSDKRLKDFQEDIEVNFSYLHNIPKKYYSWKDDATYTRHIGTSAQEVQKYYPELVNVDENSYLTMNYDKLSVVALKAIDVLHEEVTELKKENAELKERLARLEELILNNR